MVANLVVKEVKDASSAEIKELNDSFEEATKSESDPENTEHSNEERYQESDPDDIVVQTKLTYKELAMQNLKEIHPITVVIDILFLIFFFCARK